MGQPRVHPVPGAATGGAVPGRRRAGGDLRARARSPGRPARSSRRRARGAGRPCPGWRGGAGSRITRSLRSRPQQLHGQVRQQPGQPGHVIPGVEDDQDVAGRPSRQCPAAISRVDDLAELGRRSPRSRRHRGPAGPRPAPRSRRCGPAPARRRPSTASPGSSAPGPSRGRSTWQNSRSGLVAAPGPQPVADIGGQPDPPVRPGPQRKASPASDRRSRPMSTRPRFTASYKRAVTAPVLRHQRQPGQHPAPARPRTAPHRPAPTAHPPGRSGRHGNRAGTATARRAARHRRHLLASCPSRPSFVIGVLWREHMITRRPYSRRRHAGQYRQTP